jgi:uncharacterized protein YjbI with pentapeptide repeats
MTNQEHVDILKQGVHIWNKWLEEHPNIDTLQPDFSGSDLSNRDLRGVNFAWADIRKANLSNTDLRYANLTDISMDDANLSDSKLGNVNFKDMRITGVNFKGAYLEGANLQSIIKVERCEFEDANLAGSDLWLVDFSNVNLRGAILKGAYLEQANLSEANLSNAIISDANLCAAILTGANVDGAVISNSFVYGVNVWGLKGQFVDQRDLIISQPNEPKLTVDNIEVSQFIYLILNNEKIRSIIETVTSKVVLILGRFCKERKAILDSLRDELRKYNYSPVIFDFGVSSTRNLTETVSILAHMSRFVIADITDAKSIPQELERIIPDLPSVPVQPLIQLSSYQSMNTQCLKIFMITVRYYCPTGMKMYLNYWLFWMRR